jgi:two-component system response regulator AlgR
VIFCTAFEEHALAAFEAEAVDYLVKPVRRERLLSALERARRFAGLSDPQPAAASGRPRSHLCARVRGEMRLVPVAEIAYFLADAKYVEVHHDHGRVLIEDSLVSLEQEFGDRFVRVHRNCLVARDRIEALGRNANNEVIVRLRGRSEELEVSRRNLPVLRRLLRGG